MDKPETVTRSELLAIYRVVRKAFFRVVNAMMRRMGDGKKGCGKAKGKARRKR